MKVDRIVTFSTDEEEKELVRKTMEFLEKVKDILGNEPEGEMALGGRNVITYNDIEQMLYWLTNFSCDETYEIY